MQSSSPCGNSRGNSLVEYILPLCLIAVLATSLVKLLPSFQEFLTGAMGTPEGVSAEQKMKIRQLGENPYHKTLQLTLADGTVMSVNNYPLELGKSIDTIGSDGTTTALSDALQQLARQLRAEGKITEDQFNRLAQLSNQGHRLAELMRQLEVSAEQSGTDKNRFFNQSIMVDNQPVRVEAVAMSFSNSPSSDRDQIAQLLNDPSLSLGSYQNYFDPQHPEALFIGNEQRAFVTLFRSASENGAMAEPAIQRLVSDLASKILLTTRAVSSATHDAYTAGSGANPNGFRDLVASKVTHTNSADICSAGGGVDQGIHCPTH